MRVTVANLPSKLKSVSVSRVSPVRPLVEEPEEEATKTENYEKRPDSPRSLKTQHLFETMARKDESSYVGNTLRGVTCKRSLLEKDLLLTNCILEYCVYRAIF